MKYAGGLLVLVVLGILCMGCSNMPKEIDREAEIAAVKAAIETSITWCIPEKDRTKLYAHTLKDSSFFIFHPNSQSTIHSFDEFHDYAEGNFFDPRFKAVSSETREMRVNLSDCGDVAWFSCLLDDIGEWEGQKVGWINCRWTGVLVKKEGTWYLAQQHFSLPTDRPKEE